MAFFFFQKMQSWQEESIPFILILLVKFKKKLKVWVILGLFLQMRLKILLWFVIDSSYLSYSLSGSWSFFFPKGGTLYIFRNKQINTCNYRDVENTVTVTNNTYALNFLKKKS